MWKRAYWDAPWGASSPSVRVWLVLSAVLAGLMIANCRSDGRTARELETVVRDAQLSLRNVEQYRRAVENAKKILDGGNRREAIAILEEAIDIARAQSVLPDRGGCFPTEGEILLMRLYYADAREGYASEGAKGFRSYFESSYPAFPMIYFELSRMQERLFRERPR